MFRFTIRDVLLVTVVVAWAVGWLADHGRQAKENSRLERAKSQGQSVSEAIAQSVKVRGWKVEIGGDENQLTLGIESPTP